MYHNSSQKKFWTYDKEETLDKLRHEANQKFSSKSLSSGKVSHNLEFSMYNVLCVYIYPTTTIHSKPAI